MPQPDTAPVVVITGAAGAIGSELAKRLQGDFTVVGLDLEGAEDPFEIFACDITDKTSVDDAMEQFREVHGEKIAAFVHLAAYFDFSGKENELYQTVNVDGTRHILQSLQNFKVERFIYSSTMLVHQAARPGERIDETSPIALGWAYPQSKADAESAISQERGNIPTLILRLAGLYDENTAVPTLSHQIARIHSSGIKSHLHAGDPDAGQAFIHLDDMMRLFRAAIDRRADLEQNEVILAGEEEAVSYKRLQDAIGEEIHGREEWATLTLPKPVARLGAKAEVMAEPVVPDDLDKGEKPFLRPFMIDQSSDHFALDIGRARHLLDWEPEHFILDTLPEMIDRLKADPVAWYQRNGVTVPRELEASHEVTGDPQALRERHLSRIQSEHLENRWVYLLCAALGSWLLVSPPIFGYSSGWLIGLSVLCGVLIMALGVLAVGFQAQLARWLLAGVGVIVMASPVLLWASTMGSYINNFLVGSLVTGLALGLKPTPGVSEAAAETGPDKPPGWTFNPSAWLQRVPVILLAFVGLYVSLYLCAYQLGLIDSVWEPFFEGSASDPKNGTEEIITSAVSEAWPVPDAGLGAITYMLEIIVGLIGSVRRWRTMPWLVLLFGIMIVPLGAVSITFIIIQPLVIGTWSTLALIAAVAMLIQIPYSLDELVASIEYLWRRWKKGDPILWVFFRGGTDEGDEEKTPDEFRRPIAEILMDIWQGGVSLPWNLALCLLIGVWLMFTRLTLGTEGALANADHLIGALAVTVTVIATADIGRIFRFLNVPLGLAACLTPLILGGNVMQILLGIVSGLALIALCIPRGQLRQSYGKSERIVI